MPNNFLMAKSLLAQLHFSPSPPLPPVPPPGRALPQCHSRTRLASRWPPPPLARPPTGGGAAASCGHIPTPVPPPLAPCVRPLTWRSCRGDWGHTDTHGHTHGHTHTHLSQPGADLPSGGNILAAASPLGSADERPRSRGTAGGEDRCSFTHPRTFPHPKTHRKVVALGRNQLWSCPLLPPLPTPPTSAVYASHGAGGEGRRKILINFLDARWKKKKQTKTINNPLNTKKKKKKEREKTQPQILLY